MVDGGYVVENASVAYVVNAAAFCATVRGLLTRVRAAATALPSAGNGATEHKTRLPVALGVRFVPKFGTAQPF